jgi:alpha-glucosidase
MAYRFSSSLKDSLTILKENLSIQLQENDSIRFQPAKAFRSSYETPYEFKKISSVEAGLLCHLPVLVEKPDGPFIMITEANLYNYPGLWVRGTGKEALTGTNPTYPKTYSYKGNAYVQGQIAEWETFIAKVAGTREFPWRIFAVADKEEGLIGNNLVYLLASPTELKDLSWIKPGVVMFDWWAKNNIYGVDFKAGINTETAKYFIDFCAAKGFRYFLFDDGWCPKDDLLREIPGLNMPEVTAYAKTKGVDVMLWVIWHSLYKQWDQAFDLYEKWGIKGIKMDFMDRDDQVMVEFYEAVARKAAEKKMVLDFHGAYKPCGLSRKYPNLLTREALIEFEYSGGTTWDNTEHHNLLPYIRMFTGAMDYIPGTMRNSTKENFRAVGDYPMGQGTRAHSMALFVILSSPMEMLPDSPSDYYREKECTDFLARIPVEWNETRLLEGKIGQYTILGRRSGNDWFVGAITNNKARQFELATDFLKQGKYHIELIEDGINAGTRAEDYKKISFDFSAGEILKINMVAGGGWIARITPKNQ